MSPLKLRADGLLIYRDGSLNVLANVFASSALVDGPSNAREVFAAGVALARLFAAAPVMLELIQEAAADYESMCDPNVDSADSRFLARLRAAIAQGEGRS